ncbi:hypothetical protein, partial [Caballeronia glathei]|uniref:hypothetical protein n=1 Tax=Caballeronia glathei TaxID=60547 RepID=UPI0019D38504
RQVQGLCLSTLKPDAPASRPMLAAMPGRLQNELFRNPLDEVPSAGRAGPAQARPARRFSEHAVAGSAHELRIRLAATR